MTFVLVVFGFVYLGMFLGGIPGLALDRAGVAVVGAVALLAGGAVSDAQAWSAIDYSTIALLFGLMIVSAQFRLGGFYTWLARRIAGAPVSPSMLLLLVIVASGVLSALLANDIVCLAFTPILLEGCVRRRLDPVPYLIGLACGSNVGSAATLIGNPQNMLIGQVLHMSFAGYLFDAGPPALLGLVGTWLVILAVVRGRFQRDLPTPTVHAPALNRWQTGKGLVWLTVLMAAFLFTSWPRDVVALGVAGVLLTSRRMASREMFALVDWELLLLFMGLFVVNHALAETRVLRDLPPVLLGWGLDLHAPAALFAVAALLSNVISNVPAVMLLLPFNTTGVSGLILALSSTLAGNLVIVGSIANMIVIDQAARFGVKIGWAEHARYGVPVTLATLAITAFWLWLRWGSLALAGT